MFANHQREERDSVNQYKRYERGRERFLEGRRDNTYAVLNCLNDGLITAFGLITQYLPVRTTAKSPRMIAPVCTITFPFNTICCDPHKTVFRLTLLPEAFKEMNSYEQRFSCKGIKYLPFRCTRLYHKQLASNPFSLIFIEFSHIKTMNESKCQIKSYVIANEFLFSAHSRKANNLNLKTVSFSISDRNLNRNSFFVVSVASKRFSCAKIFLSIKI